MDIVKPSIHGQAFLLAINHGALLGVQSFCRPRRQRSQLQGYRQEQLDRHNVIFMGNCCRAYYAQTNRDFKLQDLIIPFEKQL
jgi:hypothetical protein